MKNRIFVSLLALVLIGAPEFALARVSFFDYLADSFNARMAAAVATSDASVNSDEAAVLQRRIEDLRAQILRTLGDQSAQTVTGQVNTITPSQTTSVASPDVPPGTCSGGAAMPVGQGGETIYCDGSRWVSNPDFVVGSSGVSVLGGASGLYASGQLFGLKGSSHFPLGAGVEGFNEGFSGGGSAVKAVQTGNGFGVYQQGSQARNFFAGKVGIGTQAPAESLDLGGGNIKMGYEVVSNDAVNTSLVTAVCPSGKKVLSGGCYGGIANTSARLYHSSPQQNGLDNGWFCGWTTDVPQITAYAICSNIR
jgi:hypothetical protein